MIVAKPKPFEGYLRTTAAECQAEREAAEKAASRDVLWKNGNKIQARYYWNYVLNLEKTEDELKKIIEKKLVKGL